MLSMNITARVCYRHGLRRSHLLTACLLSPLDHVESYAAQPNYRPEVERRVKSLKRIEKLLESQPDIPKDGVTVFVKHAGAMFEYNRILRDRKPNKEQIERVDKPQIKKAVTNAVSVEDYLYLTVAETQPFPPLSQLPSIYAGLSKSRLTMLVVLTAMGGYAMAPGVFDLTTLACLTVGTFLQSAAANATNQVIEVKYDTQMFRTRNRVLVRGLISREHGAVFALTSGLLGTSLLYYGINPMTCYIGAFNYLLYTSVYTPMKRMNILNTWVGSVVGALPPLMGWAAATDSIGAGGLWLGTLLYIWQFPHFKALSWNIRADYQRAGYMMTSVTHPDMCKRVAFRHTMLMTLACCLGPAVGCTTDMFILYSLPCNLWGVYLGYKFYSDGDSKSSRALFRFSLVQMPYLILMMIISKKWQSDKTKLSESEILNKAVT